MLATFIAAFVLVLIHVFSGRLRFLDGTPRSRWLSTAGGVSVAYVFIHLLPELAQGQQIIQERDFQLLSYLEHHTYLLALSGLVCFYGLERAMRRHRRKLPENAPPPPGIFWLHIASFSLYNTLIGYLLVHREEPGIGSLIWFTVAMGLHFVVNDFGLQADHKALFRRWGRWVLSAAVVAGWGLGQTIELSELAITAVVAFITGSVVLNVLKEELPEERESRFSAFLLGAGAYAALLLVV